MLSLAVARSKQLRTKKSLGDAPSVPRNRCLFTPIIVTRRQISTRKIVHCATAIMLTYTVNEFVSPRVKFLPKAAPVDCALLPFTLTRHFLSFLCGGHQHGKRKRSAAWTRSLKEEITPEGNTRAAQLSKQEVSFTAVSRYRYTNK